MKPTTSLIDGLSDLRLRSGYPTNAPTYLNLFALLPGISAMLLLRHHLGVRMVGTPRLALLLIAMGIWGIVPSVILADEFRSADDVWRPMLVLTGAVVGLGIAYRIKRWLSRLQGERLNTLSMGVSWLSAFLPQNTAERYVDPLLCIGIGATLCAAPIDISFAIPGAWLVLAGLMLYAIEKYLHELQLNQDDDLLNAEAHQFKFGTLTTSAPASAPPGPPVATGIDDALAASIARRKQAQPAAGQAPTAVPTRAPAVTPHVPDGTGDPGLLEPDRTPLPAEPTERRGAPLPVETPRSEREPMPQQKRRREPPTPADRGAIAALIFLCIALLLLGLY